MIAGPTRTLPPVTVADLVEAQVDRTPDSPAVVAGRTTLTYADLELRANRVAHRLQELGVGSESVVAVCLERSAELAVGLLAVQKAGGACLGLDPAYPAERLRFMVADAGPHVVLTQEALAGRLGHHGRPVVRLDADAASLYALPDHRPVRRNGPDDVGYVLYTSGSTGGPKGVLLLQRGLVNHHLAAVGTYGLGPDDRVLQFCSPGFDVSVEETFPTWMAGATLVLRPDIPILGRTWLSWLEQERVSVLNLPTAYWHEWVRDLEAQRARVPASVRLVVVGGERALGPAYRRWLRASGGRVRWLNAYGPTEVTIMATLYEAPPGTDLSGGDPPIGRPLRNTDVHLLDDGGEPVGEGEVGEIHIGGLGVAAGYLGRPEATAAQFRDDPFSARPGARLYRTGDLARLRPDGHLAFAGRRDDQVKVRGVRVELGEVEAALGAHPDVVEAAVVARESEPGERYLVGYVVGDPDGLPSGAEVRRFVAGRLPAAMVPANVVALDAFPLTPNGKLDRSALPLPAGPPSRPTGGESVTPTENRVAAIWAEVLGVDGIGAHDDFFDLGGHSLKAAQATARLQEAFGVDLGLGAIFERPTVAAMAELLAESSDRGDRAHRLVPHARAPRQRLPLTLSQQQMWNLEAQAQPPGLHNVTALHRFEGPADVEALRRALAHLVQRHESLRMTFATDGAAPFQRVEADAVLDLDVADLTRTPAGRRREDFRSRVADQDAAPFDLAQGPLARACLYRMGGEGDELAVTFEHLVCDGTSAYLFLAEARSAYEALVAGRDPDLPPLAVQYPDFALWQRSAVAEQDLTDQLDYWVTKLAGMRLGPAVPFDRVPERPTRRIRTTHLKVGPAPYRGLQHLARTHGATVFMVCVAAAQALFSRWSGQPDVVLSTTLSGRRRPELEGLIGCFHGIGRLRTDLSGDPPFGEALERARQTVLGLFEHQDIPFMRVRAAVAPHFPGHSEGGDASLLASVPTELQYFHAARDRWAPGVAVVERPPPESSPDRLHFRGQLHPLSLTVLDYGDELRGELRHKADFYDDETVEELGKGLVRLLSSVAERPGLRLSELPVGPVRPPPG